LFRYSGPMFHLIRILADEQIAELRAIAASAEFVDGRISNPHSTVKNNTQLHAGPAYDRSSELLRTALLASDEFRRVAIPKAIAPPILTRYNPGHAYGAHADVALMVLPRGVIRADLSCTIFLSDPETYEGGALRVHMGDGGMAFKPDAGTAIIYPSTTLHEVEPVASGERLVGLTFIQSRVADPAQRETIYDLGEVEALEGLTMQPENRARLAMVRENLTRRWSDGP
jgi:PKHD-type hydroxylase